MKIYAMSQQKAEEWFAKPHTNKTLVISITDPEDPNANIEESPSVKLLRLKFRDSLFDGRMTKADAREIRKFIKHNYTDNCTVIVHCHSGVSRSTGIAKALAVVYNHSPGLYTCFSKNIFPNEWCYKCLLSEYHTKISKQNN